MIKASTTPETPKSTATPHSESVNSQDTQDERYSTEISTPISLIDNNNINNIVIKNNEKLPFQTIYEEYEKFISEIESTSLSLNVDKDNDNTKNISTSPQTPINSAKPDNVSTIPNPKIFSIHLENVIHLENRLNYRFLELDAKLRFLRLLTAGTELSTEELTSIDLDSEQLNIKIENLQIRVNEMKKIGKILRKKISKCFHQSEIRRCIEGRPILEEEINSLNEKITEYRNFFEKNGLDYSNNKSLKSSEWVKKLIDENLFGLDLLENNLNKIIVETDELDKTLNDLKTTSNNISNEEHLIDKEIDDLEKEKFLVENQLKSLSTHESTSNEIELIKQHNNLNKLVGIWESL